MLAGDGSDGEVNGEEGEVEVEVKVKLPEGVEVKDILTDQREDSIEKSRRRNRTTERKNFQVKNRRTVTKESTWRLL